MTRYKIREERDGASLFDGDRGTSVSISEADYQAILSGAADAHPYLFGASNAPLFGLYRPKLRTCLPNDCLSAPSKVYLEITRMCNLACAYCYNESGGKLKCELQTAAIVALVGELSRIGTFEIRLTGGEPTLHQGLFEVLDSIRAHDLFASIGTNGVWGSGVADRLLLAGVRIVIFSLDGPEEYNDRVRGVGNFRRVVNSIRQIREHDRVLVKMNTVVCKENLHLVHEIVCLADDLGVDGLNLGPLRFSGRAGASSSSVTPLDATDMFQLVRAVVEERKRCRVKIQTYFDILAPQDGATRFPSSIANKRTCGAGVEVAAVSPFGEVYGCVVSPASDRKEAAEKRLFVAGHLGHEAFLDIWLDSPRWRVYRDLGFNKAEKCQTCRFYEKDCFGNCVVDSYVRRGKPNAESPLCFVDCLGGGK